MNKHDTTISDLTLERYLLDELSAAERQQVEQRLRQDQSLMTRLATLREDSRHILQRYPAPAMAQVIEQRLHRFRPRVSSGYATPRRIGLAFATLMVAIMVTLLYEHSVEQSPQQIAMLDGGERSKGLQPYLKVFQRQGDAVVQVPSTQALHAGEVLQLAYNAAGQPYGMVISVDGRNTITLHYPEDAQDVGILQGDGEVALPFAYELDDAPRYERFYFITASSPFRPAQLLPQIQVQLDSITDGEFSLPAGYSRWSLQLNKELP